MGQFQYFKSITQIWRMVRWEYISVW